MSGVARCRVAGVLLLWWVVVVAASAGQPKDRKIALDQALTQALVRAEFRGMGACTGDSILVKVRNLTPRPLALEITPGTLLRSQATDV